MARLIEKYKKETTPLMIKKFNYKNLMAVPKIEKVVINTSFGKIISGKTSQETEKIIKAILKDLFLITGQKPLLIKAKKSISGFSLRAGSSVAAKITLRKKRMYDFLERLIYIALPRSRDFRGVKTDSFDAFGNLAIGIKEHICFPETSIDKEKTIFGLEVVIRTTAKNKEESVELLKSLGFPIKK